MDFKKLSVSVIICNYNYADYVGAAIDSALDLNWPMVEVVVVDDGSTDTSRDVIERYTDRLIVIFQANYGQASAYNAGFARSHGEVVIFLDSDDLLHPDLMRELVAVWRPGLSKVQFQMQMIDAEGRPTGTLFPQYHFVPTSEQIRTWAAATFTYPTPPGSGNAYSRSFLEKIFPLEQSTDRAADSFCLAAAPFLGDIVTIPKPLVSYRVHGRNYVAMKALNQDHLAREVRRAVARFQYGQEIAKLAGINVPNGALNKSLWLTPYRLASLRLTPGQHPLANDTPMLLLFDAVCGATVSQGYSVRERLALLIWAFMAALLPLSFARNLIEWRFCPSTRPKALNVLLSRLKIVR
jgi:glycosyltransferase involved in cell wall biosynthesis